MGILRFILALAVVFVHTGHIYGSDFYGTRLMGGVVAVQAFYIISGFYMALILNTKYVGPELIEYLLAIDSYESIPFTGWC